MSDTNARIKSEIDSADVVLFMKGTPQAPQCGFSMQVVQILNHIGAPYKAINVLADGEIRDGIKALFELADHPAALRQAGVRRGLRHHARNVPVGRARGALRQGRHSAQGARESLKGQSADRQSAQRSPTAYRRLPISPECS